MKPGNIICKFTKCTSLLSGLRLKYKLLFFCLVIIFIPITLIGYFFINRITDVILDQNTLESKNIVYQISENLKNSVKLAEDISDIIYLNKTMHKELSKRYDNPGKSAAVYVDFIYPLLRQHRNLHGSLIKAITIYLDNDTFIQNGKEIIYADDKIKNQEWYKNTLEKAKGRKWWDESVKQDIYDMEESYTLSLYRRLHNYEGQTIGVLEIKLNEKYFYHSLKSEETNKKFFIVNWNGSIISSSDRSLVASNTVTLDYLSGVSKVNENEYDVLHKGKMLKVISNTCKSYHNDNEFWKVVSVVPLDNLLTEVNSARNLGIFVCLLSFSILAGIIFAFSQGFTKRINKLVEKIHGVLNKDFNIQMDVTGEDEIGKLGMSFNKMLNFLKELINEVYEDKIKMQDYQLKQKETELIALQNQINPHFLYNTLDAIRMNAVVNEDRKTADMLVFLSSLLRYNINSGKDVVTVRDEIMHVSNYINLMKIRYQNRLEFKTDIPDKIFEYKILKLTLQPLVENAIYHGLRTKKAQGSILIKGWEEGDVLVIKVMDNGKGMSGNKLALLKKELMAISEKTGTPSRIGLNNVNNRIKLHFGMRYGVTLSSKQDQGTVIWVRLPLHKEAK